MYFQINLILLLTFGVCQLPLTDKFDYLTHGDADSWKLYPFCTDPKLSFQQSPIDTNDFQSQTVNNTYFYASFKKQTVVSNYDSFYSLVIKAQS